MGTNARQSYEANLARFSQYSGWDYSGKLEVPIMDYSGATNNLLTEYLDYIKFHSNDDSIKIDLVSMSELGDLGCTVPTNYSDGSGYNCNGSAHSYWIDNFQAWWTKSVSNGSYYKVWYYNGANAFGTQGYDRTSGVRPVILIPKSTLTGIPEAPEPEPEPEPDPEPDTPEEEEEVEPEPPAGWFREYTDGTLYRINGEEFYVFDETYTKLHLIARYNIGSNGRQSSSTYMVQMISNADWAGQPGPLEVKVLNLVSISFTLFNTVVSKCAIEGASPFSP